MPSESVAILDENGNTVVSYGYDAWGAPLWCTGELAETLGKVQPFRYRGYGFDEETGLYYLRSRYYNPGWGRFTNMDIGVKISRCVLENNVYAYCFNNILTQADAEGTDAYWLTDSGNVGGLGHTSLLIEDDDGTWYYFYWGPEAVGVPVWTQAKVILQNVPVSFDSNGLLNLDALNDTLNHTRMKDKKPLYGRKYDRATLFTGDYSRSVDYAELLRATYTDKDSMYRIVPAYNVLYTNCMQASAAVMQASNPFFENPIMWLMFGSASLDTVPRYVGWTFEVSGFPTVKTEMMPIGMEY